MHVAVEQIEVSQEICRVLSHANLSVSPATSRAIALAILTSPDMMRDVFQTRLAKLCADERIISHCRPNILKRRLGSRQVIAYRLSFKNGKGRTTKPVELVGKRYADGEEGERVFQTMQMLWEAGFSVGSQLNIAPFGRAFKAQLLYRGPARCDMARYRPRLILSPSS